MRETHASDAEPTVAVTSARKAHGAPLRGSLVGVAVLGLALGAMLGGSALGVASVAAAEPAPRTVAHADASRVIPAPPLAVTVGAPTPFAIDDDRLFAPSSPQESRARPRAAHAPPHDQLDSAFYHVSPGRVTGYQDGRAFACTVTMVDGKPVELHTAAAFEQMRQAARRAGVALHVESGFRTMEHQRALYAAYRAGSGNLAAIPGHSNHQSGHAVDISVATPGTLHWLNTHAREFGFRRTIPTEPWHWEHW